MISGWAGTDPDPTARWTAEVNAIGLAAQAQLRAATGAANARITSEEITALVASLGSILTVLREADPADKAEVYRGLGLQLTYQSPNKSDRRGPARRSCAKVCVRGGT